ncbi:MAG TPA: DUF6528 family protein, partial [Fodinibius sp.]|nr:DUF6528 family protein [Fodinibius sp.]
MKDIKYLILFIFLLCAGCKSKGEVPVDPPAQHPPADTLTVEDCSRCMVLAEQSRPAIRIVDVDKGKELWQWNPYRMDDVSEPEWFSHPDEVKPVYNNEYLLLTASGGGVALVRIADKKILFQAMVGGNPHSAELLPDGNIVTASSTGDYLRIFHVDTLQAPGEGYSTKIPIPFGHNVVWDKTRNLLWSAGEDKLYGYEYNFNCTAPDLSPVDSLQLRGSGAHDLFPVYGKDKFWLTMDNGVYSYDLSEEKAALVDTPYQEQIKSVSSGPDGY